jgi:aspartyl aminopeptidase
MAEKNPVKKDQELSFERKFSFDGWDEKTSAECFEYAEGYKKFLGEAKTERLAAVLVEKEAKKFGCQELEHAGKGKENGFQTPFYSINRGKTIILARPGKKNISEGVRIVMAHIDSPRIDLKVKPLYESEHIVFLKTHYYGGIKKYQWTVLPLAMYGTIVRQDGTKVEISIGDKEEDPIFMITDLLPHLDKLQGEKKLDDAIPAETLNVLIGSTGTKNKDDKEPVKKNLLKILSDKYDIIEEDFVSADLELVPQGKARDIGFDRSLISGYGHDDRVCAYGAVKAFFDADKPEYASIAVLVDKEEIGSEGVTGASSSFIVDFISELIYLENGQHNENYLRDVLSESKAISADVTVGYDPDYAEVFDPQNTARIGAGIAVEKYNGARGKYGNETTAEYMAFIRKFLNEAGVCWQTGGMGKVDMGGGSTIAKFLARYNMDIVDMGPALLSMHAPFEVASKADIYSTYLAYKAFFETK